MKILVILILIAGLGYLALRKPDVIRVESPSPTSTATPALVKATSAPAPVAGRSLATIINPTFGEIFGHNDRDATRIVAAAPDLQELLAKLPTAVDSADPGKLSRARQLCALMQKAIGETESARTDYKRDEKIHATSLLAPGATPNQKDFFLAKKEEKWFEDIQVMRSQAAAIFTSLGVPGTMTSEEQRRIDRRQKARHAEEIHFEVIEVLPSGILAQWYQSYAIADSAARIGMGGNVAVGYRPSGKTIFVEGFSSATDGQVAEVKAFRDGSYKSGRATLEKWVAVQ